MYSLKVTISAFCFNFIIDMDKHFLEGREIFWTVLLVRAPTNACHWCDFIGMPKTALGTKVNGCPEFYVLRSFKEKL